MKTKKNLYNVRTPKEGNGSRLFESPFKALVYAEEQVSKLGVPIEVIDSFGRVTVINPR